MFIIFFSLFLSFAQIEGRWLTGDGSALVEILKEGDHYIGIARDGKPDENKGLDAKNPDKDLRARKLKDLKILTDLKKDNDKEFSGGKIYDPKSGNTYMCKVEVLGSDKIKFRGYVLMPLFGRTDVWTRAPLDFKGWVHEEEAKPEVKK